MSQLGSEHSGTARNRGNRYILPASIVAVLNVLFCQDPIPSLVVVAIEVLVLLYFLLKNDMTRYLGYYLMFLCLSFEFDAFVGTQAFYGFKNSRVFGINLGIIFLMPPAIKGALRGLKRGLGRVFPALSRFLRTLVALSALGIFFGLITLAVNDNNIQGLSGSAESFVNETYSMIAFPMLVCFAYLYVLVCERNRVEVLKDYLVAILTAISISLVISYVSGSFLDFAGSRILLTTNVALYLPFQTLLVFYGDLRSPVVVTLSGVAGVVLSLIFNSSGKLILLSLLVPVAVVCIQWRRGNRLVALLSLCIIPVIVLLALPVAEYVRGGSVLLSAKNAQVTSLLAFWRSNWLASMPPSPRYRIAELLNVVVEMLRKPWYLPLGKGYMGSIRDHLNLFGSGYVAGTFSQAQWENGTFYSLHEAFNTLFLYHGLFGITVFVAMLKQALRWYADSPWILIGAFWFLVLYGYSATLSAYGVTCLLVGLSTTNADPKYSAMKRPPPALK